MGNSQLPQGPGLSGSFGDPVATLLQKTSRPMAVAALAILFLMGFLYTLAHQLTGLQELDEYGFGDSYILFDVQHFQKTGIIYRDLSQPPYLPAQYSPLVYILYAIPGRITNFPNPFFGPRLVAFAAFLACVVMVLWIARALIPWRSAWVWAVLMAGSVGTMRLWVLQLRGDFPAIFLDLLAIRLLFQPSRRSVVLAGLCAGFATQFKFTYVAALAAGSLWLLVRRRWIDLSTFAIAGLCTSLGLYFLYWTYEHRMLAQMLALSPGIADFRGLMKIIHQTLEEPVVPLALLALSPAVWRADSRWGLLTLFAFLSFSIAAVTDIHVGGNLNYFFESLFAAVPLAVVGVNRLSGWAGRRLGAGLFVTVLFVVWFDAPLAGEVYDDVTGKAEWVKSKNERYLKFEQALRGHHVFSTNPRIALLDANPALMEPYLLSYSERLGKFNPAPILARIRAAEFELVVTPAKKSEYRGIFLLPPDVRQAISASYQPYCIYSKYLVQLPRGNGENSALTGALAQIGCAPVVCGPVSLCPAW